MRNKIKIILIIGLLILGFGGIIYAAPITTFTRTLLPEVDNTYDLGTTSLRYRNLYISGTCTGCGGSSSTGGGVGFASTTIDRQSIYSYGTGNVLIGGGATATTSDASLNVLRGIRGWNIWSGPAVAVDPYTEWNNSNNVFNTLNTDDTKYEGSSSYCNSGNGSDTCVGVGAYATSNGNEAKDSLFGIGGAVYSNSSGLLTDEGGNTPYIENTGPVTNASLFLGQGIVTSSTIVNAAGLRLPAITAGTYNYGVWSGSNTYISALTDPYNELLLGGNVFTRTVTDVGTGDITAGLSVGVRSNVANGNAAGFDSWVTSDFAGHTNLLSGISPSVKFKGTTLDVANGTYAYVENNGTGTITDAVLFDGTPGITNNGGGIITNAYGVRIPNITAGSNNWAIKTGLGKSQFGDNVGISTTTPSDSAYPLSVGGVANFTTATSSFYGKGLNLSNGGCYAIAGVCIGGSSGLTSYDAFTHPSLGLSATTSQMLFGTSTASNYQLTVASSTAPQLSLSAGAGLAQWTFRNQGGIFALSTTTTAGNATSTANALTILNNNFVGLGVNNPTAMFSLPASTTASGGINFGDSTANLYRSAAGTIRTDNAFNINGTSFLGGSITIPSGTGYSINGGITGSAFGAAELTVTTNQNLTSNTGTLDDKILAVTGTYAGTSGGGAVDNIFSGMTVNQSGSATSISRGVYVSPTLTAAYDFRGLELAPYTVNMTNSTTTLMSALLQAQTYASTTATTLTNGYTEHIYGGPIASTNVTISTSTALMVEGRSVVNGGAVTNAYGLEVFTPTGATNNYTAHFQGPVGIGDTAPSALLSVGTTTSTNAVGGMYFGKDTTANWYRSASGQLKTDASTLNVSSIAMGSILTTATIRGFNILQLQGQIAAATAGNSVTVTELNSKTHTSGAAALLGIGINSTGFAPTSGTGTYEVVDMNATINQTGNSSGLTRSLLFSPTLTAAYDHRVLEIAPYTYNIANATTTLNSAVFNPYTVASTTARTITNANTMFIPNPPIAANNITISTSTALLIGGGMPTMGSATTTVSGTGVVTTAIGAEIYAPVGGGTNIALQTYGAVFMKGITTASSLQTGDACFDANNQVTNDSVVCVASALRYKENINPLPVGLDEILKLRPVTFDWKKDYMGANIVNPNKNRLQYSLIADEVQKIDPLLVETETATTTFMGVVYPTGSIHGLADMNHWVALFVQGFHDEDAKISDLQKTIANLKLGVIAVKRSAEENWQWYAIIALFAVVVYQGVQIRKIKNFNIQ